MKHMAMRSIRKMWNNRMGNGKCIVFKGSMENFIENGALALQESVSLFNGKTNPIRYLSVDELNAMNLKAGLDMSFMQSGGAKWYKGFWDGKWVLVKESQRYWKKLETFREIIVSAQMSTHKNVHKLLGCCIETKYAVLVYEYVENITLDHLIFKDKPSLDWKQRLKIAWEISHALAYLHTGFQRPIVHRDIKPIKVFFGKDGTAKLSDFSLSISIPEGKEYVEDIIVGTLGYLAPEYVSSGRVAESVDVYEFGVLFLQLLTGTKAVLLHPFENQSISDIIDHAIAGDTMNNNDEAEQQLTALIGLALKCTAIENNTRPTMEEVATQLKSMITNHD